MMKKKSDNKLYGILGGSLDHSLSPLIHNYLFKKYNLEGTYNKYGVDASRLKEIINAIRILNISGLNITFPLKQTIIPFLDKLDASAIAANAVNTIKQTNNLLVGYNTDLNGIGQTIKKRLKINLKNKTVLLLGAGGAAGACLSVLLNQKTRLIVCVSRTKRNIEKMIESIPNRPEQTSIEIAEANYLANIGKGKFDLIINATSAGPEYLTNILKELTLVKQLDRIKIFDLNYGDRSIDVRKLRFAAQFEDGLYMLCAQAVASFQIWTGIKSEPDNIYNYVKRKLREIG